MKAVIYILSSIVITSIGYFSFVNKKVADVDPSVIEYIEIWIFLNHPDIQVHPVQ